MIKQVWVILEESLGGHISIFGVFTSEELATKTCPKSNEIVSYTIERVFLDT